MDVFESVPADGVPIFGDRSGRDVKSALGQIDIVESPIKVGSAWLRIVHLKDGRLKGPYGQFTELFASGKSEPGDGFDRNGKIDSF